MRPGERVPLLIKILAPVLLLLVLNIHPASVVVQEALGTARNAQTNGQYQDAANQLRLVVAHEPWRVWLWEQIGNEEVNAGRMPQAVDAFTHADAAGHLSPQGRYQLGEVYFQLNNLGAAEAAWQELLAREENVPAELASRTYERMAQLQRSRGDFRAAAETLRAWHAVEPDHAQAAFLLGLHLAVINPAEAVQFLIEASNQDSSLIPTVQAVRQGISTAGESDDPGYSWLMIGRALGSVGQWDLAAEAFGQAVAFSPLYAEAWAFLGEAHFQLGKDGQADLDRAVALDGKSAIVRALLAMHYRQEGNYDLALVHLQAAVDQEPEEPMWEVELGNTWAEKGDLPVALEHFQNAVNLAPKTSLYYQYLARFCVEYDISVQPTGLPAARQAVVLSPDDPGALDVMGWTMVYLEDFATAERFLQQALERDATYALASLHLGQLYLQQQDFDRAYPYIKQASVLGGEGSIGLVAKRLLLRYYNESS